MGTIGVAPTSVGVPDTIGVTGDDVTGESPIRPRVCNGVVVVAPGIFSRLAHCMGSAMTGKVALAARSRVRMRGMLHLQRLMTGVLQAIFATL